MLKIADAAAVSLERDGLLTSPAERIRFSAST